MLILEFPAFIPDVNTIENLWGILVRDLYANSRQFGYKDDLRE